MKSANFTQDTFANGRTGSLITALIFLIAGIVTYYDATTYTDMDSKVFPQTSAIALMIMSVIVLVKQFIKPTAVTGIDFGNWWRRILLVSSLYLACVLMPIVGMVPAAGAAFILSMLASMHHQWTIRTIAIYSLSGGIIIVGFYSLFRYALQVPLP